MQFIDNTKCSVRLLVDNVFNDDNSIIGLSEKNFEKLELFRGDPVLLKGNEHHETICISMLDETCSDDCIRINHAVKRNLRVHSGEFVLIQGNIYIQYGKSINILPVSGILHRITDNLLEVYLKPYFNENYRPVCTNDMFTIHTSAQEVEFQVINTDPSPFCIVAPDTIIHYQNDDIKRKEDEP